MSSPACSQYNSSTSLAVKASVTTVAVAVQVELDGGRIAKAGIGLTSVGATNLKATEAEKALARLGFGAAAKP